MMASRETPALAEHHRRMVEVESGLPLALVEARGYFTATKKTELERLGFSDPQRNVPALVIPMYSVDGDLWGHQSRADEPRFGRDGKPLKYESPRGLSPRLDVHPAARPLLADKSLPLWVTEGVKKGDALVSRGLCAVALLGVWLWKAKIELADWDKIHLKGRKVYVVFDSDVTQKREVRQALRRFRAMLERRYATFACIQIPSRDGRKVGVDDYLAAGGSIDELLRHATREIPGEAGTPISTPSAEPEYPLTEAGLAERLVNTYGKDFRWVPERKKWTIWTGTHWSMEDQGAVTRWAISCARDGLREAADIEDEDLRAAHVRWYTTAENCRPLQHTVHVAAMHPGQSVALSEFDQRAGLLNVANGTIDLRTGEMRPHQREDYLSRCLDIPYSATADCPRWVAFLDEIFEAKREVIQYVWKALGYSLTGESSEKCFHFCHGSSGDNGKSVFIGVIHAILGPYAANTPTETLMARQKGNGGGGPSSDIARLRGVRFLTAAEAGEGSRLDEELIKQVTGGDTLTARYLYGEEFEFRPQFALWMTGNYRPTIRGTDRAIWRRVRLVPFQYSVPPERQDRDLMQRLVREEAAGILAWMIAGCQRWREKGLCPPPEIMAAVHAYREEMDEFGLYVDERTRRVEGARTSSSTLYADYERWAKSNGLGVMSSTKFGRKLVDRGCQKIKSYGVIYYGNIDLAEDPQSDNVYRGGE